MTAPRPQPPSTESILSAFDEAITPEPKWMRLSRADLCTYAEEVFGLELKSFHRQLFNELQKWTYTRQGDPRRTAKPHQFFVNLPRGFGKSTCICGVYPSWRVGNDRNIRIIITSNTEAQGKLFLRQQENIYLFNEKFRQLYGHIVPDSKQLTWNEIEKIVIGRTDPMLKDATFFTVGVGGAIINRRADIIIADDIVDQESVSTKLQRDKIDAWFWTSLRPVLEPGGQLVVSGTRYHSSDLYEKLIRLWQDEYKVEENLTILRS